MGEEWSDLVRDAIEALLRGDVAQARDRALAMGAAERSFSVDEELPLSSLWNPFLRLLHRRGYFVASDHVILLALGEILDMGPGFDLYDLAAAIARCDFLQARRCQAEEARVFPELSPFFSGASEASNPES